MKKTIRTFTIVFSILLCPLIIPAIFGISLVKKLDNAALKEELRLHTFLSFFLLSPIVTILLLCLKSHDLLDYEDYDTSEDVFTVDREEMSKDKGLNVLESSEIQDIYTAINKTAGSRPSASSKGAMKASGMPSSHSGANGR